METVRTAEGRGYEGEMEACVERIKQLLSSMETKDRVGVLNRIRKELSEVSPFDDPVDLVQWVPVESVQANDYNPNKVAPAEMELLHTSIDQDGFTQPVVVYQLQEDMYEITDGFHRRKVAAADDISWRHNGYLPVSIIDKPLDERIGSTIRHNRARGTHQIRPMSDIVISLTRMGWPEERISRDLGMELDEIIRLKQISGLQEAFQNHVFSKSWIEFERKYYKKK